MSTELSIWTKKICILIGFGILGYILYTLSFLIFVLGISGFLTIILHHILETGKKYKIPEWVSILGIYILVIGICIFVVGSIVPIVISSVSTGVSTLSSFLSDLASTYRSSGISGFGFHPYVQAILLYILGEDGIQTILVFLRENAGAIQAFVTTQAGYITTGSIGIIGGLGGAVTTLLMIGVVTCIMLLERVSVGKFICDILPTQGRIYIEKNYSRMEHILHTWVRGQAILGISIAGIIWVGLYILEWIYGVDTGSITTLALIAGIMECIPYIGPFLALAPALVLGLGISWQFGVSILVLYIVVQQVENNLLVPYIMSKSLDLSPLLVLVVMIAGASLGGILGIVLAVPVAGVVQMLYRDYRGEEK